MKRRSFLGITLGAFSLPVLAQAGRLYGTPQSVTGIVQETARDRLKLELSRVTVPADVWEPLARLGGFWERVLHDSATAIELSSAPRGVLARYGLESVLDQSDPEVKLLMAISDPAVQALAADGSYSQLFQMLANRGLLRGRHPSELREQIRNILSRDLAGLRQTFAGLHGSIDEDALLEAMEQEPFSRIAMLVSASADAGTQSVVAAAVLVVIAVGVVAYVSAVISVTVGITLGFSISAAVSMVVAVGGPCDPVCYYPYNSPDTSAQPSKQESPARPEALSALVATMTQVDTVGQQDLRRISRAAMLLGNRELPRAALRNTLSEEVEALFGAYRDLRLLELRKENYDYVVASAKEMAFRAVGVSDLPHPP